MQGVYVHACVCGATTAVTAITAQNTTGVSSVVSTQPKEVEKQILFTCKDIKPDAIKIGMLNSSAIIFSVIKALKKVKNKKIDKIIGKRFDQWISIVVSFIKKKQCIGSFS